MVCELMLIFAIRVEASAAPAESCSKAMAAAPASIVLIVPSFILHEYR
jgi:hypothetical protein